MGLLDDLKNEAEKIKESGARRETEQARREQHYQTRITPALKQIYHYLRELLDQLAIIQPEIGMHYRLPNSEPVPMIRTDVQLTIDSLNRPTRISMPTTYTCGELKFAVLSTNKAAETRQFLESLRCQFSDWPVRGRSNQIEGIRFVVPELQIHGGIEIGVDREKQQIVVEIARMGEIEQQRTHLATEDVTDDWLDKLGRFVVGEASAPTQLEIDDHHKETIRAMLADRQREAEAEMAQMAAAIEKEDEKDGISGKLKSAMEGLVDRIRRKQSRIS